ncbi:MAG: transcriptional repressor NrdR [Deltaproteobacteria bacterium]|nr:transcriptional repressor NrdR [Deltaproteobacteria bacterium]
MKCPFCAHMENKVIDSRLSKDGDVIRRRRECNDCGKRFTTYERVDFMPQVVKADARREPFEHATLLASVRLACQKRPVLDATIDGIVDDIEKQLQETGEKDVESSVITEEVLSRLAEADEIAFVRYAARYRKYSGLEELSLELARIAADRKKPPPEGSS